MKLPPDTPVMTSTSSSRRTRLPLGPIDLGAPQELEHAVRERRGPRAAAREREDDQVVLVLDLRLARLEAVARYAGRPA